MRDQVKLQKTEEGYSICCPSLPGCWYQGDTEEKALENIKDAILAYNILLIKIITNNFVRWTKLI